MTAGALCSCASKLHHLRIACPPPTMTIPNLHGLRAAVRQAAFCAASAALLLALISMPALRAADAAATPPPADQGPKLPLTATFEKVTGAENGPFVLKLKNTGTESVKVNTKILLSVVFHAENKAKKLPEHVIAAGQVWTIPDLVAADKVILTADGFAPLELVVPFK